MLNFNIEHSQLSLYNRDKFFLKFILILLLFVNVDCFAFTNQKIQQLQNSINNKPVGEKIVFWAEKFIDTPYDPDPKGAYVTRSAIVADDTVDCMYLVFRCVELAFSNSPQQAINVALIKRFFTHGVLQNNKVINYDERYQYGEDMITSGKWGKEITNNLGITEKILGTRDHAYWEILPSSELIANINILKSGDLIFFILDPKKRSAVNASVGHMGIIDVELEQEKKIVYLIHAHGHKNKPDKVVKVPLTEYIENSPFIGVQITRF
jgi:hypothetical protein